MRHGALLPILLFLFIGTNVIQAEPVFFPRRPAISPDGSLVVFSFQGDLWRVSSDGGQAVRITVHPAYDRDPVFSPDGKSIVFASDRYDQFDLFIIPVEGGTPRRLTYAGTPDIPQDWTSDGRILFKSPRFFEYPMSYQLYVIQDDGGTPFRMGDFFASEITMNHDKKEYLFARGDNRFGRTGYRGTLQSDIWYWKPGSDPTLLVQNPGYDTDPMWSGDGTQLFWRGEDDETHAFNIWRMNLDKSGATRLTDFREEGVRNAKISRDGSRIVFEAGTDIYSLDTRPGASAKKLKIDVASDQIENPVQRRTFHADADEISLSDDGEEIAMVVHGEIILVNKELGGRAAVPIPDAGRDFMISFKPGTADTLLLVTDRIHDGDKRVQRLALLVSDDPDENLLRKAKHHKLIYLTKADKDCHSPQWSPKGDRIAYIKGNADLHVMDADGKKDKRILKGWSEPSFSWSPDGRWIAYSREDRNYNQDIWIMPSDGGKSVNISQHPDDDFSPVWSQDGRMIAWTSRRHANEYDVFFCYLTRADDEMTREEWEEWEKTRDKVKKDKNEDEKKEEADKEEGKTEEDTFRVRIDFDDIYLRARRITTLSGDEFVRAIHPKGDRIIFTAKVEGKEDLYSVNRFGEDLKSLTSGGVRPAAVHLDASGKTIIFLKNGVPAFVGIDGGSVETTSFNATLTIDKPAERLQIMEEGWRTLGSHFYDPKMHGIDWDFVHDKIAAIVTKVSHDDDFADAVNIMLRTLNASHMGYYPDKPGWTGKCALFGIAFDPDYNGKGLRIDHVLPHGPADKVKSRALPGDILLEINNQEVSKEKNLFRPMEGTTGIPVLVKLKRGEDILENEWIPGNWFQIRQLAYKDMENSKRKIVEKETKDKVSYVHIQGMGLSEVERFEQNLYAAADGKDALIIDVRNNGGGWTTDMLLTILTQPVHAYTLGRDGEIGYPQPRYPLYRWEKPIAVICNEHSYSNAEIFSHAVKTIDRGPVVGTTTGGNVISTSGWGTLDGGFIRLPGRGWYVWGDKKHPERNNLNEEHGGCVPDYPVDFTPGDRMKGQDPQLEKAIELMKQASIEIEKAPKPKPQRARYSR